MEIEQYLPVVIPGGGWMYTSLQDYFTASGGIVYLTKPVVGWIGVSVGDEPSVDDVPPGGLIKNGQVFTVNALVHLRGDSAAAHAYGPENDYGIIWHPDSSGHDAINSHDSAAQRLVEMAARKEPQVNVGNGPNC